MSVVDAFSPEEAIIFARKMFKRECEGWGDEERALDILARRCGLSAISYKRLMNGKRKTVDGRLILRIRQTYFNFCLSLMKQLHHEAMKIGEVHGYDAVESILADVEALEAKTRAEKEKIIQKGR